MGNEEQCVANYYMDIFNVLEAKARECLRYCIDYTVGCLHPVWLPSSTCNDGRLMP